MTTLARCQCEATWTGLASAHCGDCHQTFASVSAFDRHRIGPDHDRRCDTAIRNRRGEFLLIENDRGYWSRTGDRPSAAWSRSEDGNR